ncbi:DUF226 domain-containing protein (plasmid) [Borreliella californiensis]|uniref:Uncharacterized protein n=1 Tax=Borreliella californiensis TaxID=373543 RepID=A0A7W9ZLD6_9SPIR|nr:DUF226 domain-containing protein [Borreliella californiensis]MBB6213595.1 hypothetical protein [Borreliella californiensis]MBB6213652.1 hypothetical protein [Borreliella californiensis]
MNQILEGLKYKEMEIGLLKKKNNIFIKKEKINNKTLYHTKIFRDIYTFGINQRNENKFFITLRNLFDINEKSNFHLFRIKESINDEFLGMFYGFKRLTRPLFFKYKDVITKAIKTIPMYKIHYIEFRYKKGSVFCYIKAIHALTKKEKFKKKYAQNLLERIINLEHKVYRFYNKNLSNGGIIIKWITKNQK